MELAERPKDPGTVAVFNLVIPGAGYLYAGRMVSGLLALLVAAYLIGSTLSGFSGLGIVYLGVATGAALGGYVDQRKAIRDFDVARAATVRVCPYCAETIKIEAGVCRFCHRELTPAA